jgi:iron complex transport system substrate-binding protein
MKINLQLLILLSCSLLFASCEADKVKVIQSQPETRRIISLNGSITEVLFEIGLGEQVVGIDVTSTFPEQVKNLPSVGHTRQLQSEGILSLQPDLILAKSAEINPDILQQLKSAGVKIIEFDQEYSVQGTLDFIQSICDSLGKSDEADRLKQNVTTALQSVVDIPAQPTVLFIYARGTGNLTVAGEETHIESIIKLAGGKNAVSGFSEFKPLNTEVLATANPDALLMFTSGLSSLDGKEGLMQIPGVEMTKAGQKGQVFEMDGQLLSGFGPRLGIAVAQLNQYLLSLSPPQ